MTSKSRDIQSGFRKTHPYLLIQFSRIINYLRKSVLNLSYLQYENQVILMVINNES